METAGVNEERANYLTHGLGLVLAVIGFSVLIIKIQSSADIWKQLSYAIYGATVVLLFGASTLYHAVQKPRLKKFFRIADHIAIYLLIAGTYTPFLLLPLRGTWGWTLLVIIWGLAIMGTGFKIWFTGKYQRFSTGVYLGMGWLAVIAVKPMVELVPPPSLGWLVVGGLCYSLGVIFYNWKSLPYHHAVWHLFVLAGSTCHFLAISLYL